MSIVHFHQCPIVDCRFNRHPVNADAHQTKKHLWSHSYSELLPTARNQNLIHGYVRPSKGSLVDYLTENSVVRSDQTE